MGWNKVPLLVTPDARLISPSSCWLLNITVPEEREFRALVKNSSLYVGECVERFDGVSLTSDMLAKVYREAKQK